MSKRRQFHVLDGVLRDLVAAVGSDGEGYDRAIEFGRIIADIIDILDDDDADLPDAPEGTGGESDADVDLHVSTSGPQLGRTAAGYGPDSPPPLAQPPRVDPEVGHHVATQLSHGALPGRPGAVVRTELRRRLVGGGGARGGG